MKKEEFDAAFEKITKTQRMVLKSFLAGKTDEAIAQSLSLSDSSTVRRHIAKICREFEFKNQEGEHFSYRQELIELFAHFRPDLVNPNLLTGVQLTLEFPEGQIPVNSIFYIERSTIESDCYQEIFYPGTLILIKAPKLMGKTSLLTRIMAHAAQHDYRTVQLNLRLADKAMLTSLDNFLRGFCQMVSRELQLEDRVNEYWDLELLSSNYNCTSYFEEYLLPQINCPLVLGLDESDRLFHYPEIAQDFFGLLRLWHEKSKNPNIWQKLRLVVVHSTEVYIQLDANKSPFNVGMPINLPEFTQAEVQDLASRHQLNWQQNQVEKLMAMVGGHPYLVRLAMYYIKRQNLTLEDFLATAATDEGIYSHHLKRLLINLQEDVELFESFKALINSTSESVQLERFQLYKLYAMGLVKFTGVKVQPRCDLYRRYFSYE
ncbi:MULTISPECIES: AAA-like domain-containing protein [Nostoc]|uniref:AAA-like domain-containing protein n=1 Tax=Nostoc paludosum FACHB-159 TaxID=2692908 RepID=A0ABR8K7C8_9NOSO|nr:MULTISPECIES: AAA-like domain-containing protein [Nostoc]MBD2678707.1 AAA-like domain-containing protein [Nostoc sp. FACHB-857]MBD2734756.1 AAA-like domain-containing protein [Nostoc paludosum FACHB-159]